MANKRPLHLFLGIILICLGAGVGFIVARILFNLIRTSGGFENRWMIGYPVLCTALGTFCVWMGSREFQRASGQEVKEPGFRWGRMLAGIWIVFSSLKSHYSPSPNALKADNDSEAAGMLIATIAMTLAEMLLIAYSVKPRKPQPIEAVSQSDSDQAENVRIP